MSQSLEARGVTHNRSVAKSTFCSELFGIAFNSELAYTWCHFAPS